MSETKHTRGPWHVREYPHLTHPFTQSLYEIGFGGEGKLICDAVYKRADAILIAAAPDMLSALKACEEELRAEKPRMSFISMRMCAAIAKAEGGAK